jgi:hypothetical protein
MRCERSGSMQHFSRKTRRSADQLLAHQRGSATPARARGLAAEAAYDEAVAAQALLDGELDEIALRRSDDDLGDPGRTSLSRPRPGMPRKVSGFGIAPAHRAALKENSRTGGPT